MSPNRTSAKNDAPRGGAQTSELVKSSQNFPASIRNGLDASEAAANTAAPASELTSATARKYKPSAATAGRRIAFHRSLLTRISLRQTRARVVEPHLLGRAPNQSGRAAWPRACASGG